ncbi:SLAM family member 9 isoform X2 [Seriola aureovittata]|uniref:SLAM family member 9 isoform X2 n=1 Tax=Seriola aureovittata TaxID=2871759 RepID=UPI0024BE2BF7|nr:SLAM family member 9 isoform X2 [Seriola aureovittata]
MTKKKEVSQWLCFSCVPCVSVTMRHQVLLIALLQGALVPLEGVPGYLGANVTLKSGANASWNLSKIEWSVFSNNTWIATYRKGITNIERISRYKGRLSLNISSGDLTIHNLTSEDAMEYTVDLINTMKKGTVNKIKLEVMQRLKKPSVKELVSAPVEGGCFVVFDCSSQDQDVTLSWEVKPLNNTAYNMSNPDGKPGVLLAFLNTTQKLANFTCTSSRTTEKASNAVTAKCHENPCPGCAPMFFLGLFIAFAMSVGMYCFREKIESAWKYLKDNLPQSEV